MNAECIKSPLTLLSQIKDVRWLVSNYQGYEMVSIILMYNTCKSKAYF